MWLGWCPRLTIRVSEQVMWLGQLAYLCTSDDLQYVAYNIQWRSRFPTEKSPRLHIAMAAVSWGRHALVNPSPHCVRRDSFQQAVVHSFFHVCALKVWVLHFEHEMEHRTCDAACETSVDMSPDVASRVPSRGDSRSIGRRKGCMQFAHSAEIKHA